MGNPEYQKKYGMVTVESKIINIHGERVELEDDVPEVQELVVATSATRETRFREQCFMMIVVLRKRVNARSPTGSRS